MQENPSLTPLEYAGILRNKAERHGLKENDYANFIEETERILEDFTILSGINKEKEPNNPWKWAKYCITHPIGTVKLLMGYYFASVCLGGALGAKNSLKTARTISETNGSGIIDRFADKLVPGISNRAETAYHFTKNLPSDVAQGMERGIEYATYLLLGIGAVYGYGIVKRRQKAKARFNKIRESSEAQIRRLFSDYRSTDNVQQLDEQLDELKASVDAEPEKERLEKGVEESSFLDEFLRNLTTR